MKETKPFGLKPGSTPAGEGVIYSTRLQSVPQPHPLLQDYSCSWIPEFGLVAVNASSDHFEDDGKASRVLTVFNKILEQLTQNYGEYRLLNELEPDSFLREKTEFRDSITSFERKYLVLFSRAYGSQLPDDIVEIRMEVTGSGETTWLDLDYMFPGCPEWMLYMEDEEEQDDLDLDGDDGADSL